MGHTPGPWRTEGISDCVRVVIGKGRQKVILARLAPPQLPEEETWANARIMGAGPELLDALTKAEALLMDGPAAEFLDEEEVKRIARAAIEKAGGKVRV